MEYWILNGEVGYVEFVKVLAAGLLLFLGRSSSKVSCGPWQNYSWLKDLKRRSQK